MEITYLRENIHIYIIFHLHFLTLFLDCPRQLKVVRAAVKDVFLHFERDRWVEKQKWNVFLLSTKVQLDFLETTHCQF